MTPDPGPLAQGRSWVVLRSFVCAALAGAAVGVLGSLFRLSLDAASRWREGLVFQAHAWPVAGFIAVVAGTMAATMAARWLVLRFSPIAAGSGVQHVEAVMRGQSEPAGFPALPVKFVGGVLAIGAGLPLGREGPTVQMGAVLGDLIGGRILRDPSDRRAIVAAGAGAGLGVAFNTPIGAAVFVFEELTRTFVPRQVLAALAAAAIAMAIMRAALGDAQLFSAGAGGAQPLVQLPVHFALGAILGLAGVGYGRLTTASLDLVKRFGSGHRMLPAAVIGALVGVVGWFYPGLIGGGEALVQNILSDSPGLMILAIVIAVRLVLCPISYAAGVPGGLFAPLLVIGAGGGTMLADLAGPSWPTLVPPAQVLAVVGMAAIFTAVVRAPLTGIVMTIEMTGRADCALPILTACLAATLFASLAKGRPIYDILRERMLSQAAPPPPAPDRRAG